MSELPEAEYPMHHHTIDSQVLKRLKESPLPATELHIPTSGPLRDMIRKINQPVTTSSGSKKYGFGSWSMVYYLYGDERRAIRVTVEENEEYIKQAFESEASPFKSGWGEGMYEILNEEWSIYRRESNE